MFVVATIYALGLVLYVVGLADAGFDHATLISGQPDPKSLMLADDVHLVPLLFYVPIGAAASLAAPVTALLAAASAALLATRSVRARPSARRLLLAAIAASLIVVAITLTPFGSDLVTWHLD